jgi:Zn-dependent metalloprotease
VSTIHSPRCITPPYLLEHLLRNKDGDVRRAAMRTLLSTARLRGERTARASFAAAAAPANGRRTVFDCRHSTFLSNAVTARSEDGAASADVSVNRAFDGLGATRDFYRDVFDRNSIDGRGMRLDGYVHYGRDYNNAFWNGRVMVFGDGDGVIFSDFTGSLDVIGHELTHGVTEFTAGLDYHNQSGALNESISDTFGSLVKQWSLKQTADEADWLIGSEVFTPGIAADALRSMKAPGTAYDNDLLGKDPQPDRMSAFVQLPDTDEGDNGGVHINSGIPNKAFYLAATGIGGYAWEGAGAIWYAALKASTADTNFQEFADTTVAKATELFGGGGAEHQAVVAAWREVEIRVGGPLARGRLQSAASPAATWGDGAVAALSNRLDDLSKQVAALTKDVGTFKKKS